VSIVKNISINSIIGVISKIIVFALLPIILEISNPEVYGQYGLILIVVLWFEKVTVGPFTNGLARWFHKKNVLKSDFSQIIYSSILISIILASIGSVIFYYSDPILNFLVIFLVITTTVFYSYMESSLRFQGFHKKVAIYMGIRNVSIPFFQILFLKYNLDISSFIIPIIFGNLIFSFISFNSFKGLFSYLIFDLTKIKGMLYYSVPLIIVGLSVTSFFLIDRYLVKQLFGFEKLAELTLAAQIAAIFSISISTPIKQVLVPDLLSLENNEIKFQEITNKIYGLITIISIIAISVLFFLHDVILDFLDKSGNYNISKYLVFLFLVYHFLATMSVFYKAPYLLALKSKYISYVSIASMIISLIFLILNLEKYGLIIIGYSYLLISVIPIIIFRFYNNEKYKLPKKIVFIELLLLTLLSFVIYFNPLIF